MGTTVISLLQKVGGNSNVQQQRINCGVFLNIIQCLIQVMFLKVSLQLFFFNNNFVYLLLAALDSHCCTQTVSNCGEQGPLFVVGFSLRWLLLLWSMGCRHSRFSKCSTRAGYSALAGSREHGPSRCGAGAQLLCSTGTLPRPRTEPVLCVGRRILTSRKVPASL